MFCDKQLSTVFRRKHVASIEPQAERSDVRPESPGRRREFLAAALRAEFRIRDIATMAIGKAEVHTLAGRMVEFAGRDIVAHHVPAIIGEPQFAGLRVPGQPYRIAHARRKDLAPAAIDVDSNDLREAGLVTYITGCTDRDVQHTVRTETDVPPAVVRVGGQIDIEDFALWHRVEMILGVAVTEDTVDFGHVQVAIVKRDTVRRIHAIEYLDRARGAIVILDDRIDRTAPARRDEQRAPVAQHQRSSFGRIRVNLDCESGRQPNVVERSNGKRRAQRAKHQQD